MKKLLIAAMISTMSLTASADNVVVGAFLSSSATPLLISGCFQEGGNDYDECSMGLSYGASTTSTILLLKEDIQQVEVDGYAFLAGEEMTLALEDVINKARQESAELDQMSDAEVTTVLLQSVK